MINQGGGLINAFNQSEKFEYKGQTPLIITIIENQLEVFEALLARPDLDVNKANRYGDTPLKATIVLNRWEMFEALLAHPHIDVNKADASRNTPLISTIKTINRREMFEALIARPDLDVNKTDTNRNTPLILTIRDNLWEMFKALIAHPNLDVNKADEYGQTPLINTIIENQLDMFEALLARPDLDVNKADEYGDTPLMHTIVNDLREMFEALLARPDIDIDKANRERNTPLIETILYNRREMFRRLLERARSSPLIDDRFRDYFLRVFASNPLIRSILDNRPEQFQRLLQGVDETTVDQRITQQGKQSLTPLKAALLLRRRDMFLDLYKRWGARPTQQDQEMPVYRQYYQQYIQPGQSVRRRVAKGGQVPDNQQHKALLHSYNQVQSIIEMYNLEKRRAQSQYARKKKQIQDNQDASEEDKAGMLKKIQTVRDKKWRQSDQKIRLLS